MPTQNDNVKLIFLSTQIYSVYKKLSTIVSELFTMINQLTSFYKQKISSCTNQTERISCQIGIEQVFVQELTLLIYFIVKVPTG